MANWYFRLGNQEYGPIPLDELARLAVNGDVTVNDWVREGESNPWRPVSKTPQVMSAINAPRPAVAAAPPPRRNTPMPAPARPAPHSSGAVLTTPRPAPPKPMPAPAPARAAVAPAPLRAAPAVPVAAAGPEEKPSILERRKSSGGPIIAAICAVGGLLLIGGIVVMMSMGGGNDDDDAVASKPNKKSTAAATDPASDNKLSTEQINVTKSVKSWRDADKTLSLKGLISFEIKRVYWLDGPNVPAPDMQKMQEAALDTAAAATGDLNSAGQEDLRKKQAAARELVKSAPRTTASGPQLCVELSITNVSSAPLTMTSWNSHGKSGAWVVDDKLKLVSLSSGSGGTLSLAPGQSISDTLQFSTGTKDFSELRLVLPYSAVARTGQSGFRLDGDTLAGRIKAKVETPIAQAPAGEKPQTIAEPQPAEPTIIDIPEKPENPGVATNKAPMVDDGEPKEDIRDLIKKSKEKP
jgi:hypothetical protein